MIETKELTRPDYDLDFVAGEKPEYKPEDKECAKIANDYLKRLSSGEITLEEFEKEIAYWFVTDYLNKLHYKPLPTKPNNVVSFEEDLNREKKKHRRIGVSKFDEDEFTEKAMTRDITNYYDDRNEIENINNSNLKWLIQLKSIIPAGDLITREKLTVKINEFRQRIEEEEIKDQYYSESYY